MFGGALGGAAGSVFASSATTRDLQNTFGGALGGFLGGAATGMMSKGGNAFLGNIAKGIKGGVLGGLAQDATAMMLKSCVCSAKK